MIGFSFSQFQTYQLVGNYLASKVLWIISNFGKNSMIYLILETNIHFREWNAENQFQCSDESKKILSVVGRFFSKITENSLQETLGRIDRQYLKIFWRLFDKYKVYNRVNEFQFSKILNQSEISLIDILTDKQLVEHYGNPMCQNSCRT